MRPTEKKIQNLINHLNDQTRPELDKRILLDCFTELNQRETKAPAPRPNRWRRIMNNRTIKAAIAASIGIIAILGITVFDRFTTPAWAIEQTIQALQHVSVVHLAGYAKYPDSPTQNFEVWTRPSSENPSVSGDFLLYEGDSHVALSCEQQNLTWVYTRTYGYGIVYITEGLNRRCTPFPTCDLFRQFQAIAQNWKEDYRKDPRTGRDSVYVTFEGPALNTAHYWQIQFDLQTKLPVRAGVWWDKDYSGQPHFDYTTIEYDVPIPKDTFTWNMPQDTQLIDCRILRKLLDENPDYGIAVDDLAAGDACKKVATEYWQAVIEQDSAKIRHLRPLAAGDNWNSLSACYQENQPAALTKIASMNHLDDPGTFAEVTCLLQTRDGKTAQSILNIEIRQTGRGKIGVVAGVAGPELVFMK